MRRVGHLIVIDGGRARPRAAPARASAVVAGGAEAPAIEPAPAGADPGSRARSQPPIARLLLAMLGTAAWLGLAGVDTRLAWAAAAPLLAASLLAPLWAWASMRAFDRDAVALLASGRGELVEARLARAVGLRAFGTPEQIAERVGAAAMAAGDPRAARAAYARAIACWSDEDEAPLAARIGHAHACHALGDDDEAEWAYRRLLATHGPLPRIRLHLAHARIRRGLIDRETRALLEACARDGDAPPGEIALVTALGDAIAGRRALARARARSVAPSTDREHAIAGELARALEGALRSA